ncbi:MAG: peptidoglycan DD-metalloendopeptidase family protein [Anaerolineae bacterium]|nr:peptidoglycan DD-metalloendopeptidase family protein [Anaerolineae bacterium]
MKHIAAQGILIRRPALAAAIAGLILLAGCAGQEQMGTPMSAANLTATAIAAVPTRTNTPVPTIGPTDTPTLPPTPTPSNTPTATRTPFHTNTPRPSPTPPIVVSPTGQPGSASADEPTWTPPPLDPALTIPDHYWMARPIPADFTTWVSRNYPYGSTNGGRLQTHHGVDIQNGTGTPVIAVQDGTVIYAGDDLGAIFGPQPNFYGNVIVIQHDFVDPGSGEPVYSLYGHLLAVKVESGQRVTQGDEIGLVGGTGVALGPHLHFEVRVGNPSSYTSTRNPELWLRPYRGYGTLAGRITDAAGNLLRDVTLDVTSARDPGFRRAAFTYADDTVNGDTQFGENYALGDLPADYYNLVVRSGGTTLFRDQVYVHPNRTTWVEIQLR